MPHFTDAKRERIREQLHETGRELFARYGLQKTTIAELTEPAGIATGTFYQFYDSKEELYVEILRTYGEEFVPRLLDHSFEAHDDPEAAVAAFLEIVMDEIESNPLVHQIVVKDELDRIEAQYTEDELATERERNVAYFLPYIERWYDEGRIAGPDPATIAHAIRSVALLSLHEDDVGEDVYDAVRETVITAFSAGLTDGSA